MSTSQSLPNNIFQIKNLPKILSLVYYGWFKKIQNRYSIIYDENMPFFSKIHIPLDNLC